MNWWRNLKQNPLARLGAIVLILLYLAAIFADFVAPYDPFSAQKDGSLLPPTAIHWQTQQGQFIGPHIYPTTQGAVSLETGDRALQVDRTKPAPLRFLVKGTDYQFLQIKLTMPTQFSLSDPKFDDVEVFPGIKGNLHLFGTTNQTRFNLLGTDEQARDQFSRLVYGSRISMSIGLVGVLVSFPLGMLIGGISGYFGGWIDAILMRIVEVLMTIPTIYLLVALAAVLPPGMTSSQRFLLITLITSFVSWSGLARVIRGQVLSIKQREFVQAAKVMGAGPLYIINRHILPQTATYVIISATLAIPSFIGAEAVLSFIGLGIQQPDPSWGNMLNLALNASILVLQPWLVWSPAILIVITTLSFNLLGDGLRDALDPRNTSGRASSSDEATAEAVLPAAPDSV
jgi:peptide/nickel transport system permease protein